MSRLVTRTAAAVGAAACLVAGGLFAVRGDGEAAAPPAPAAAVRANVDPLTSVIGSAGQVTELQAAVKTRPDDPGLVARLTPFVRGIDGSGDHWVWRMSGIQVLGHGFSPTFTERMTYDEPSRIEFHHDPPEGKAERAGVNGWYALAPADGEQTRLETTFERELSSRQAAHRSDPVAALRSADGPP